jgi:hypothetical protein
MAKIRSSIFIRQGTTGDMIRVRSKYGDYLRHPRGTFTHNRLNKALSSNARKTAYLNGVAKPIHNYIKQACGTFPQSDLWQCVLGRLRKAGTTSLPDLLGTLPGLEINQRYPLQQKVSVQAADIRWRKRQCSVALRFNSHVLFPKSVKADCYYYAVHLLWLDGEGQVCGNEVIETEWVHLTDALPYYELSFRQPVEAKHYLLFLAVQGGAMKRQLELFAAMGMCVLAAGSTGV